VVGIYVVGIFQVGGRILSVESVLHQEPTSLYKHNHNQLVGGFNPSEKYESQFGLLLPIYGKS
jgi:hypothetical protein